MGAFLILYSMVMDRKFKYHYLYCMKWYWKIIFMSLFWDDELPLSKFLGIYSIIILSRYWHRMVLKCGIGIYRCIADVSVIFIIDIINY